MAASKNSRVQYFDALENGTDITAQITGENGWSTGSLAAAATKDIRVVVTPDETVEAGGLRIVPVTAKSPDGLTTYDLARLLTRVESPPQVDALIRKLSEENYTGNGVYNETGSNQTRQQDILPGSAAVYLVKVQNKMASAKTFKVTAPAGGNGWTVGYYTTDLDENDVLIRDEDITAAVTSGGWTTPELAASGEALVWVEVTPDTTVATDAVKDVPIQVARADDETQLDVVLASTKRIRILAGLRYSVDQGENWTNITDPEAEISILEGQSLGIQALKTNSALEWPDDPIKPAWDDSGSPNVGETIYVMYNGVTDVSGVLKTVTAECGDQASAKVRVYPNYQLSLGADKLEVLGNGTPSPLSDAALTVSVKSWDFEPLTGVRVRFVALDGDEDPIGQINGTGSEDDEILSASGLASAVLHSGPAGTEAKVVAQILAANGTVLKTTPPITIGFENVVPLVEAGEWTEDDDVWTRTITVTLNYGNDPVPGRTITLQTSVLEDGTPAEGYANAAPFVAASGVTDAAGTFTTTQTWSPPGGAQTVPGDYEVKVTAASN